MAFFACAQGAWLDLLYHNTYSVGVSGILWLDVVKSGLMAS